MDISNKEVVLLLSGNEYLNKQVVAHSQSLKIPVNVQEQLDGPVTSTLYSLVLEHGEMEPKHLLDRSDPQYQNELKGKDMSRDEWVRVLQQRPDLLRAPIAIRGDRVIVCEAPSQIQSLEA
jgi:arsenate reductase